MKRFLSVLLALVLALPLSGQSSLNCSGGCGGTGNATVVFENPGGRCTTESNVGVSTSDRTSQGTLYYTPWLHNNIVTYSGAAWQAKVFAQISLSLSITTGKNYDVFVNAPADTLSLSSAWTNDTTRADALGTQDGVQVLGSDHTKLWLCTIRATGTNVTEDSDGKRFVWNTYNQIARRLYKIEQTTHTYTTGAWQYWRNDSANKVEFVAGNTTTTAYTMYCQINDSSFSAVGPAVDTAASAAEHFAVTNQSRGSVGGRAQVVAGYHYIAALEFGGSNSNGFVAYTLFSIHAM